MPVNPKNNSLGLVVGAIAFLGLGFCSPPAPANEAPADAQQNQNNDNNNDGGDAAGGDGGDQSAFD